MKKLFYLLVISVMVLSGCDRRNNREWVENRVSEVSRVYPTADLNDLFKEFPDGFTIEQNRFTEAQDGIIELTLIGDATSQTISGSIIEWEDNSPISQVEVTYQEGAFAFSDETKAKELWPMQAFLFQSLNIDKTYLSSLKVLGAFYSLKNGAFRIKYEMNDDLINHYLKPIDGVANLPLSIHGSDSNRGYYFSLEFYDYPFSLDERVYETEK